MKGVFICGGHLAEIGKTEEEVRMQYETFRKFLEAVEADFALKDSKKKEDKSKKGGKRI
jgi:hypothetical protein